MNLYRVTIYNPYSGSVEYECFEVARTDQAAKAEAFLKARQNNETVLKFDDLDIFAERLGTVTTIFKS